MTDNEYFILCDYDSHYPHNAYFISPKDITSEFKEKINNVSPGIYISSDDESQNDEAQVSNQIWEMINCIRRLLDSFGHIVPEEKVKLISMSPEFRQINSFVYYINDDNRYLSPKDLYFKLTTMTEYRNKPVIIKKCIMLSDTHINTTTPVLRFFIVKKPSMSCSEIKQILLKDNRICNVQIASTDGIDFLGYGYVNLTAKKYENDFFDKTVQKIRVKQRFTLI